MKKSDTKKKVVMVTGAAQGVGAALVELLLARGDVPVVVDVGSPMLEQMRSRVGSRGLVKECDVTSRTGMRQLVDDILACYGQLDVVVANAGIERIGPLTHMEPAQFERVMEVNVLGVYRTLQPALAEVVRNGGHVIAVSSVAGLLPWPFAAAYGASKAAVDALMRSLRIELAPLGATAGAVYFGHIDTPMMQRSKGNPVGHEILSRMPRAAGILPRPPQAAARAILRSIDRRSAREFSHFSVRVALWLRGLYQLFDPLLPRQLRIAEVHARYYPAHHSPEHHSQAQARASHADSERVTHLDAMRKAADGR